MGRSKNKPRKPAPVMPAMSAAELFAATYRHNPALTRAYHGTDCIVAVTVDGRPHGWGATFQRWSIITIKDGTKPRGAAAPADGGNL